MPKDIWTQAAEESYQGVATEEPSTSKPMDDIWTQAAQQSLGIVPDNPIQPTMDPEQYRMAGEAMQTMGQPDKPGRNVTIDPLDVALRSPEARAKAQQIAKKGRGFWGELFNSYVEGSLMVGGGMAGTVAEAARLADKPGLNWIGEKASQISKKSRQARQVPELAAGQKGTAGEFVAQAVGNAFPFMAASVGATMLTGTPLAAFGVAFSVEGEETYQKAIKDGASFEKANLERLVVGTLNGAIESLQVGTIFKGGQKAAKPILDAAKQKAMKKILAAGGKASVALVKTSVEEGLEEALQETISMTAPVIHGQPVPTVDQYIKQAGKAGLGGAVAGGILGGGRAMMEVTGQPAIPAATQAESVQRIEAAGFAPKQAQKIATDIQELQAQADAAKPPAPLTPEQSKNVTATLAELEAASKPPAEAASVPEAVSPAQATPPPAKAKGEAKPSEPPYIPEGVVPPQAAKPKEPWEMTREEYAKTSSVVRGNNYIAVKSPRDGGDFIIRSLETSKYSDADAIALSRKDHIRQALSSGHPVPSSVLAEYPELTKPTEQEPLQPKGTPDGQVQPQPEAQGPIAQTSEPTEAGAQQAPAPVAEPPQSETPPKPIESPEPPKQTSSRQADLEEDRKSLGLKSMNSKEKQSFEQWMAQAESEGVPDRAFEIAAEVIASPRPLTAVETAGFDVRMAKLKREHGVVVRSLSKTTDEAEVLTLTAEKARIEAEDEVISRASHISQSEKGRALVSSQLTLDEDLSLIAVLRSAKANKGKPISKEDHDTLVRLTAKIDQANAEIADLKQQVSDIEAKGVIKEGSVKRYTKMNESARKSELDTLVAKTKELLKAGCY